MRRLLHILLLIGVMVATSNRLQAYATLTNIKTREELKELGPTIRLEKDGDKPVGVTIEFKARGKMQDYNSANLEVRSGERVVVSVPLHAYRKEDGTHRLYFSVDREYLKNTIVTLYTGQAGLFEGYNLRIADLAEMSAVKKNQ